METATQQPIIVQSNSKRSVGDYIFGGAAIVGLVWFGNKMWKKHKAQKEAGKLDSPAAQAASKIKTAIEGAGTSEKELYNAARFIVENKVSWGAVAQSYRNLYAANIEDDLRGDLDAEELKTFYSILNFTTTSKTTPPPSAQVQYDTKKYAYVVVTNKPTNVRKSPTTDIPLTDSAASVLFPASYSGNIILLVKENSAIGILSGVSKVDNKGTLFYEVLITVVHTTSPLKVTTEKAWVAASQIAVKQYATPKDAIAALSANKNRQLFTKALWDRAKFI